MIRQPLFSNAGYLLGVDILASVVGFAFWGLAARLYRPADVGLASSVLSAIGLIASLARLGMGTGLVRFLPQSPAPRRMLNVTFTFIAITAAILGGLFLLGLPLWSPSLLNLRRNWLYAAGFLTGAVGSTLGSVVRMAFVAHRRADYALAHTAVVNLGRLLLLAALAGLGRGPIGLVGAVALAVIGAVSISLWGLLPKLATGYRVRPALDRPTLTHLLPFSISSHAATLLIQTLPMILPLVALERRGAAASSYVYIAWMVGSLLTSPGIAVANSALAESAHAPRQSGAILLKAALLGLSLTLPAALLLLIAAPWLLLLFGPSYASEAAGLLRWLTAAAPVTVVVGVYFTHLRMRQRNGQLILLSTVIAALTLGVTGVGMERLGVASSGIGWLMGNSLVLLAAVREIGKEIGKTWTHEKKSEAYIMTVNSKPSNPGRVVAAIPCYNEARFIGDVVRQTAPHVDVVIVVDDGSTDETTKVAQVAGARTVRLPTNMGPGAAAQSCLRAAREAHADVLVTLDGDGQHDPAEIPTVIGPILSGEADLVIGSRFMGGYNNVAPYRRFGIGVITLLYNLGARVQISDAQSCFRAYNRRALDTLRITEPGFGFSVETLVQARTAGLRIREVSISCRYHPESHSMNPVLHGLDVVLRVIKHRALSALNGTVERAAPSIGEEVAA